MAQDKLNKRITMRISEQTEKEIIEYSEKTNRKPADFARQILLKGLQDIKTNEKIFK